MEKEFRVYVVSAGENFSFEISGTMIRNWGNLETLPAEAEEFMQIAEENGSVYTLNGFMNAVNIDEMFGYNDYVFITSKYPQHSLSKRDKIEKMLIDMWVAMGIDVPHNYENIVQYVYEDVCDTADRENWHSGDVAIAFRRWIEAQAE